MTQLIVSLPQTDSQTYSESKESYVIPQMQILKYMGNKRRLLEWLIPILTEHLNYGDTLLDLFAGTSSVGYALKPQTRIIANDIQAYSEIMSRALLESTEVIKKNEFNKTLLLNYNKNLRELNKYFNNAVKSEDEIISKKKIKEYVDFCSQMSRYGYLDPKNRFELNKYSSEKFINNKRKNSKKFPFLLFSTYYSNTYFSLKQSIEIDSLRYSIEQIKNKKKQAVYLSCLMFALSKSVNSSGHFAEYLNSNSDHSANMIFDQRNISIIDAFLQKLSDFENLFVQNKWKNKVYCLDYKILIQELIKNGELDKVKFIYIDPPYTSAQYSRFYHIPETLIKYDYPVLTEHFSEKRPVKGGYRNDRHQSSFSQNGGVEKAFKEMFEILSSRTKATLAISYSDNSLLKPIGTLIDIASNYYNIAEKFNGYVHSAQGSKFTSNGKGVRQIHEYLLICTPKE